MAFELMKRLLYPILFPMNKLYADDDFDVHKNGIYILGV